MGSLGGRAARFDEASQGLTDYLRICEGVLLGLGLNGHVINVDAVGGVEQSRADIGSGIISIFGFCALIQLVVGGCYTPTVILGLGCACL